MSQTITTHSGHADADLLHLRPGVRAGAPTRAVIYIYLYLFIYVYIQC